MRKISKYNINLPYKLLNISIIIRKERNKNI